MSPYYPGRTRKSKALNDLAQRRLRERVANRGSFNLNINTNKGTDVFVRKQQLRSPQRLAVFKNDPQCFFLLPQRPWAWLPLEWQSILSRGITIGVPVASLPTNPSAMARIAVRISLPSSSRSMRLRSLTSVCANIRRTHRSVMACMLSLATTFRSKLQPPVMAPVGKNTAEEPTVELIHALARDGLEKFGHHGPMAAMGVPRPTLPQWDDSDQSLRLRNRRLFESQRYSHWAR